jgi:hypothetical protein
MLAPYRDVGEPLRRRSTRLVAAAVAAGAAV